MQIVILSYGVQRYVMSYKVKWKVQFEDKASRTSYISWLLKRLFMSLQNNQVRHVTKVKNKNYVTVDFCMRISQAN